MTILEQRKQEIGDRIKGLLKAKGWSQADLARELDVHRSFVTKMLSGGSNFTLSTILELEQVLDGPIIKVVE